MLDVPHDASPPEGGAHDLVLCEDLLSDVRRFRRKEEPERARSLQEALYLHDVIQRTLRLEGRVGWSIAPSALAVTAHAGDASAGAPTPAPSPAAPHPRAGLFGNSATTTSTVPSSTTPATVAKSAATATASSDDPAMLHEVKMIPCQRLMATLDALFP